MDVVYLADFVLLFEVLQLALIVELILVFGDYSFRIDASDAFEFLGLLLLFGTRGRWFGDG